MPEAFHHRELRSLDARRHRLGVARRGRIVVLAGEEIERAERGVDLADAAADVALDLVEVEIAGEHARPALHVVPDRFPAFLLRACLLYTSDAADERSSV